MRGHDLLEQALPAVLQHLALGDALSLSWTSRSLRAAVAAAWRPRPVCAVIAASLSSRLVLLDPHTGCVLRAVDIPSPPGNAEVGDDSEAQGGSWAPCVEVDVAAGSAYVSQYEGSCVLEYTLPGLALRRRLTSRQLTGQPLAEPEGLACANGCLYVAWLLNMAVSATPLEAIEPASACTGAAASARPRVVRGPPGRAEWIFWGLRRSPDGALYVAANPPYTNEGGAYGDLPPERGRGFVARLALDARGLPHGPMRRFTRGGQLSRPSGLCFDDAGDLYVTHMGCQVLKFGGPHRGAAAGKPLGVFIDCCAPSHRLTPDPRALRPCPVDIAFHGGLLYLTTHTTREDGPSHGCLSVWGRHGRLLAAHGLGKRCLHPNGLALYTL